ncbi:MAG TPA: substrate-binding domain-containing protein [Streptosporangiaceae bacterium]
MTVLSSLRSNASRRRSRPVSTKALVIIAVVGCFTLLIGRGTAQIIGRYSCSSNQVVLNVAVSQDIAPAITKVADYFNRRQLKADGRCVSVSINTESPALAAGQIDGQGARPHPPIDAWIPDSSLWVDQARRYAPGAQIIQATGYNLALSPLMLVMPKAAAAHTAAFGKTGWRLLLPRSAGGPPVPAGLRVDLPDPTQSAAGLATLMQVGRLLGQNTSARVRFTRFIYSSQVTTYFDDPTSLGYFAALAAPPLSSDPVTDTTEQPVLAYDRSHPKAPLAATYPSGRTTKFGSPELDYPYVLTSADSVRIDAAEMFGRVLKEPYAQAVIRFHGFRSGKNVPDKFPASAGLASQLLQVADPPSASEAPAALAVWNKLALGSRDLTIVDVSSAMAQPASPSDPTGPTFEEELTQTASLGLALFPDTANIGLWEFADNLDHGQPYKQLVSVGPLPGNIGVFTRRAQLQRINGNLPPTGGPRVALYGTILDAYKYMQKTYKPRFFNAVIVLASGIDNAPGDISAHELVKTLTRLNNSPNKVAVIIISFSPSADFPMLKKIALATGGQAYRITDPTRVAQVFYQALAHRLCGHSCVAP